MDQRALVDRVAGRYLQQRGRTVMAGPERWEEKIVGPQFRLQWTSYRWELEELPQKGKKKLHVAGMQNMYGVMHHPQDLSALHPKNIIKDASVTPSDSFDHVKTKLLAAMKSASERIVKEQNAKGNKKWDFILDAVRWDEKEVYFTKVMPEGMEPFSAEGKDFLVKVEWTSFKSFSPDSDFQQADAYYTMYEASSPTAARKLYQILKEDPKALSGVSWAEFSKWLTAKKIGYSTHFSSHH